VQKIFDGKLILIDYNISFAMGNAFKLAMISNPNILNSIFIENCGVNDRISA
jgi:hypothetical protein